MNFDEILSQFSFRNLIDVLLVAVLIYQAAKLLRSSRAWQVTIGMLMIVFAYWFSGALELETINWVISRFFSYLIIVVIVLFQDDIRRLLTQFGSGQFVSGIEERSGLQVIDEMMAAAQKLSHERLGGLVVFERGIGLERLYFHSVRLESLISEQLLISIFQSFSPLHDGAVIVRRNRIICASAHLPLSKNPRLGKKLGTRHSAAVGISEQSDAVVLVVSEETGGISIAVEGELLRQPSVEAARTRLVEYLLPKRSLSATQRFLEGNVLAGINIMWLSLRRNVKGEKRYGGPERRMSVGRRPRKAGDSGYSSAEGPSSLLPAKGTALELRFPGVPPQVTHVEGSGGAVQPLTLNLSGSLVDSGSRSGSSASGSQEVSDERNATGRGSEIEENRPSALKQSLAAAALDEESDSLFPVPEAPTPLPAELNADNAVSVDELTELDVEEVEERKNGDDSSETKGGSR